MKKSLTFYVHRNWYKLFQKHDYWLAANTIPEFFSSKAHVKDMGKEPMDYRKVKITIEDFDSSENR